MSADVLLGRAGKGYGGTWGGTAAPSESYKLGRGGFPGYTTPDYQSAAGTTGDYPKAGNASAIDPGVTFSGTNPQTASPFSPISYAPVSITDMVAPSGGGGINPLYLIIGIVALIGIAAYFMVKK